MSHAYWLLMNLVLIDSLVLYHWLLGRRGPERQLTLVWSLCLDLLPIHELSWGSKIVCLVNLHSILNSSICGLANKMFSYLIGYSLRECLALHLGLMYLWVVDLLRVRHDHVRASIERLLLNLILLRHWSRVIYDHLGHLLVLLKALILRKLDILDRLRANEILGHLLRHHVTSC